MTRLPCNQSFLLLFKKTASCKTETRVTKPIGGTHDTHVNAFCLAGLGWPWSCIECRGFHPDFRQLKKIWCMHIVDAENGINSFNALETLRSWLYCSVEHPTSVEMRDRVLHSYVRSVYKYAQFWYPYQICACSDHSYLQRPSMDQFGTGISFKFSINNNPARFGSSYILPYYCLNLVPEMAVKDLNCQKVMSSPLALKDLNCQKVMYSLWLNNCQKNDNA
jgi:hypothetical protein